MKVYKLYYLIELSIVLSESKDVTLYGNFYIQTRKVHSV